jgi:tetratricopeptide (TPR) repeat protein
LHGAANLAVEQGDSAAAKRMYLASLDLCRDIEESKGVAHAMCGLACVALDQGDYTDGEARSREGVAIARSMGERSLLVVSLGYLGTALRARGDWTAADEVFSEALAIARDIGEPWRLGETLLKLGRAECDAGHWDSAAEHLEEGITILHELVFRPGTAGALEGFATVALATGSALRAVRLWASAEAVRREFGAAMCPADRRRYDCELDTARAQLSTGAFDKAWNEGRAMTLDEAVRYALDDQ